MKFSVIIPVYNSQRYLRECIDSVLEQSYPVHEIILIDDGSSDSSGVICDEYQAKAPERVKVVHTVNRGALAARATGITLSTGEVLVFLDADDRFRQDAVQVLNHSFETSACDLIIFNGSVHEDFSVSFRSYPFADGTVFAHDQKQLIYRTLISSSSLNNICLKAAKRSVFDFNLDYSCLQRIQHGEDLLISAQMLASARKILILDQNLYFYRQNADSIVHASQLRRADSVKTVHQFLEELVVQWDIPWIIPLHHAREVQGWIETTNLLRHELSYSDYLSTVQQMSEEPYFCRAYEKMDASVLSRKVRFLSNLLYRRWCRLYCVITRIF